MSNQGSSANTASASSSAQGTDGTTHFGFRDVRREEKAPLVQGVFSSVAENYDLMNDLMSGGIHRLWKSAMIDWLNPQPGMVHLDVAGGTGDIAFRSLDRAAEESERRVQEGRLSPEEAEAKAAKVVVCDLTHDMLRVGRDRALDQGRLSGLEWVCGDAMKLPLPNRSVDAYTIAFGLRNVTDIDQALREAHRVLKPGGHFLCLEFSQVILPLFDQLYDLYSFKILPHIGQVVAGDKDSYQYLVESIRKFPPQDTLKEKVTAAGFGRSDYRNLSGGIAAIHSGWRI
ncbi:bifunctional demethylmenaquinone methyltransferase/2-methoxy-6-polyprenyl-1,4-benzoquinol methylase UbiE [Rhodovibrionaceae bacterium A322]